jgi:hypothetical protein
VRVWFGSGRARGFVGTGRALFVSLVLFVSFVLEASFAAWTALSELPSRFWQGAIRQYHLTEQLFRLGEAY